ncbi:MAG: DUF1492 domain-containing protein [Defluviitaleaceae bacterium]|nr:DUF1492 domain-containing protein [Defluviitaleaceae bacterium]
MNVQDYLRQAALLHKELEFLKERITELRVSRDNVRAFFVKEVVSRRIEDRMAANLAEVEMLEDMYMQKVTGLLRLKYDYHLLLDKLSDRRQRVVLEMRYIDMLSFEDISERIFCSLRTCFTVHSLALSRAQELWDEDTLAHRSGA